MLLQFTVKNFLSFKDEVNFKMSSTSDESHPEHVCKIEDGKYSLLKTAAIYGANASGKTNLIEAIKFVKNLILDGIKPSQNIPIKRFKLSAESSSGPTFFELEIYCKDTQYIYGIVLSDEAVLEEWLFSTSKGGRKSKLFERTTIDRKVVVKQGSKLNRSTKDGVISFIANGTRPEQPFLTELESRNVEIVSDLMKWFRDSLNILSYSSVYRPLPLRVHKDKEFTKQLGEFLRLAGTGISDLQTKEIDFDIKNEFDSEMPPEIMQELLNDLTGDNMIVLNGSLILSGTREKPKIIKLKTLHISQEGKKIEFSISEESSGTQRLLHLFPSLFSLAFEDEEKVFIIDELDRSLHPHLSRLFLEIFLKNSKTQNQLIFTTHEDCLLDLNLLRRDEIWFVEKDQSQSSICYPLTDFKVRPDLEIRKGYLNGRFGAIPFFGNPDLLGWNTFK